MNVKAKKKPISVTVNIKPGPLTHAARQQWHSFWSRVVLQVNDKVKEERQRSQKSEDKEVTDADK